MPKMPTLGVRRRSRAPRRIALLLLLAGGGAGYYAYRHGMLARYGIRFGADAPADPATASAVAPPQPSTASPAAAALTTPEPAPPVDTGPKYVSVTIDGPL